MHVRLIRPDEWRAFRAFRLRALATDPRSFGATLADEEAMGDEAWQARARDGAAGVTTMTAVSEDDAGAWLGMIGGRTLETPGERELIALWTAPEARGRGIAERLLRFGVAWARRTGGTHVVLWYVTENQAAARVYERCGFVRQGPATQGTRDPTRWFQKMALPPAEPAFEP